MTRNTTYGEWSITVEKLLALPVLMSLIWIFGRLEIYRGFQLLVMSSLSLSMLGLGMVHIGILDPYDLVEALLPFGFGLITSFPFIWEGHQWIALVWVMWCIWPVVGISVLWLLRGRRAWIPTVSFVVGLASAGVVLV